MEILLVIGALILAAFILFWIGAYIIVGAVYLLGWASEQKFIGLAAYVACWVLLFPFMLAACAIAGFIAKQNMKREEREERLAQEIFDSRYEARGQDKFDNLEDEIVDADGNLPLSDYEKDREF